MPQITGGDSARNLKLEVSTNGTVWTNVSGAASTVGTSGGAKATGESYTFEGDDPIVTSGKSQPFEVTVTALYTEGASDLFEIARPIYEAGTAFYLRWSPLGGQTGEFVFTTGIGRLTALTYPGGDAAAGGPIMTGLTWRGPKPTKSVAT